MMLPRLKLLRELLRDDGAIFLSIDDNEVHHLRCLMDEVFGEENFVATICWHKMDSPKNTARHLSEDHDYVLLYARNATQWKPNRFPRSEEMLRRYKNPDNDPRGDWLLSDLAARNKYSKGRYSITTPTGKTIEGPPAGSYWRVSKEKFENLDADNRIWWGESGSNRPGIKRFLAEVQPGVVPQTIWHWKEAGSTRHAKQEMSEALDLGPGEDAFVTPKPSRLIRRILQIATDTDSIVLDSFAGSGTTAHAVLAQNRDDGGDRRFILVECEDYADSLTAERVRRVINGIPAANDDALAAGFGGTFSFFELGRPMRQESLLDGSHLPSWEKLASYVFFTATGQEFDPGDTDRETGFVGHTASHDVFLFYEPDVEKLKSLALSLSEARALPDGPRRKLVFAPTKYLDREFLHQYRIDFQQLPFQIYEAIERLER